MTLHLKLWEDVETKSCFLGRVVAPECLQHSLWGNTMSYALSTPDGNVIHKISCGFHTISLGQQFQKSSSAEMSSKTHVGWHVRSCGLVLYSQPCPMRLMVMRWGCGCNQPHPDAPLTELGNEGKAEQAGMGLSKYCAEEQSDAETPVLVWHQMAEHSGLPQPCVGVPSATRVCSQASFMFPWHKLNSCLKSGNYQEEKLGHFTVQQDP